MDIGENIRKIRINKKLTQAELAKKAGISREAVVNYEADKRKPSYEILLKIADALNIPLYELLSGELGENENSSTVETYLKAYATDAEIMDEYLEYLDNTIFNQGLFIPKENETLDEFQNRLNESSMPALKNYITLSFAKIIKLSRTNDKKKELLTKLDDISEASLENATKYIQFLKDQESKNKDGEPDAT